MIDQMQDVIMNTKQYYENYEKMYTTCYWSGIRMSNCRDIFQANDAEAIHQLGKFAENLMISSEQIINMAEEVQTDLRRLQSIEDVQLYCARSGIVKEKLDMIALGNKYMSEQQSEFARCTMIVKKIIEQSSRKPSKSRKIKTYLWKKRNNPKTTG